MDMKEMESTLSGIVERLRVANRIVSESESFDNADELMELPTDKLAEIANALGVTTEDVEFIDTEETMTANFREFVANKNKWKNEDGEMSEKMKKFLDNDLELEDKEEFLGFDNAEDEKMEEHLGV